MDKWGGRQESNLRPPGPQSGALTNWATPAMLRHLFGAPEEIRTPDTRLRRPLLYPTELQAHLVTRLPALSHSKIVERVMGIGPTRPAWKAGILPLNYTRIHRTSPSHRQRLYIIAFIRLIVKHFFMLFTKKFKIFFLFIFFKKCDEISF